MTRKRRFIAILLLTALMILAFLGGSLSAASSLTPQAQTAGQVNLTDSQWAAVQAGNSLLTSWWSNAANYLPLIIKE
jgi:hypothetical protein